MAGTSPVSAEWWKDEFAARRHEVMWRVVDRITEAQQYRKDEFLRNVRLYGASGVIGLDPTNYTQRASLPALRGGSNVSFNVVKSCADAYVAKLTKDKPKMSFVTDGANDQLLQDKAKGLERFTDGQLYELDFYRILPQLALDTCVFKNAILKLGTTGKGKARKVCIERITPTEIRVDDAEAVYGRPGNLYQEKRYDRAVAKARWPKFAQEIDRCQREAKPDGTDSLADHIVIREGWHLPSEPGAADGLHVICIQTATIFDEKWTRDEYPFCILRRADPLQGWWGVALADDLAGIQRSISKILFTIERHYHLLGASKVVVPHGFNKNKFDNDIDVIEANLANGAPYVLCPQNIVAPEMYQHLDRLYAKAYELSGINQMSAQSQIPQQVESGKAIQALADVESDRFMTSFRLLEHFVMDVVKQILVLAREISETNASYAVRAFDDRGMSKVVFQKNWLKEEEYVLKMHPTNLLADDPVAKMGQVEKLSNAGWIQPDEAMRLLDYPDTQASANDKNANYSATKRIVANILDHGEYVGPDPIMNLAESVPLVRSAYLRTVGMTGVDPKRVDMLRDWLTQAQDILTPPPPPAQPVANMQAAQATQALQSAQAAQMPPPGAPASAPQPPAPSPP